MNDEQVHAENVARAARLMAQRCPICACSLDRDTTTWTRIFIPGVVKVDLQVRCTKGHSLYARLSVMTPRREGGHALGDAPTFWTVAGAA